MEGRGGVWGRCVGREREGWKGGGGDEREEEEEEEEEGGGSLLFIVQSSSTSLYFDRYNFKNYDLDLSKS